MHMQHGGILCVCARARMCECVCVCVCVCVIGSVTQHGGITGAFGVYVCVQGLGLRDNDSGRGGGRGVGSRT